MSRWIRIPGGIALVVVGLVGLLLLAGPLLFSSEALQEQLEDRLAAQLGQPVSIGTVRVRLVPTPTVRIESLRVGGEGGAGAMQANVAVVDLRAAWRPLLDRRLEIRTIEIEQPVIELAAPKVAGDGTAPPEARSNAEGRVAGAKDGMTDDSSGGVSSGDGSPPSRTEDGSTTADSPGALDVRVDEFVIRDGSVRQWGTSGSTQWFLDGWDETLAIEWTRGGVFHLRGETAIAAWSAALDAGTLGRGLPVKWQKTLIYRSREDDLEIAESDFLLGDLPVTVTGRIDGASSVAPELDLAFSGGPAAVDNLLGVIPAEILPDLQGIASSGRISVSGHVKGSTAAGAEPDFELTIEIGEGRVVHPSIPEPIEDLVASLLLRPDLLRVEQFTAQSGQNRIRAKGTVTNLEAEPQLDLALDADVALEFLTGLRPPEPDAPVLGGRLKSELVLRGPAQIPDRLEVLGIVTLIDVSMSGPQVDPPLSGLSGRIEVKGQTLWTDDLRFDLGESDFAVSGTISNYFAFLPDFADAQESPVDLVLRSRHLDVDAFSAAAGGSGGRAFGGGGSGAPGRRPSDGGAVGSARPAGEVDVEPRLAMVYLEKMRGPLRVEADEMIVRGVRTENARGEAQLRRGLIDVERMTLRAFGGEVGLTGAVDLRKPNEPEFDLATTASSIDVARLLEESVPLGKLTAMSGMLQGTLDGSADFEGALGSDFALRLPSLTSIGNVQLAEGKLDGHPLQSALATFLDVPAIRSIQIADWLQPFEIRDGRLVFEGLSIRAGEYELQADGWQSIDGQIELAASFLLPQSESAGLKKKLPSELVPILFDGSGTRLLVPLQVSGPTAQPRVTVDRERVSASARRLAEERIAAERRELEERLQREKDALSAKLEEEKQRAREELERQVRDRVRDQAGGLLDGVLGSPPDSTAADSSVGGGGVEEELEGLLKGLFKKKK